jgi:hypothetical protein
LTSAPKLPATTLANDCYYEMFYSCTKLTTAPELPATSLEKACYSGMFNQCVKLTTAPELPATTLAYDCYSSMFYGCRGLTTAPDLPATTLNQSCYYRMFYDCTGLTTAPDLPAETLAIQCYSGMFVNCSKLNYIKMLATNISASNCLNGWVSGVAAIGTFVKSSFATWNVTGTSGVPEGWTVLTAIPTPEAVDLGLPSGVKWASFNLGATAPEDYGDYYAWGENNSGESFGASTYRWASEEAYSLGGYKVTKYCPSNKATLWGGSGNPDGKSLLDEEDDAAHSLLGGNWRTPTIIEWEELFQSCTWEWVSRKGYRVTSKTNSNSIFLPAAGYWDGSYSATVGPTGTYMSSSLYEDDPRFMWCAHFNADFHAKSTHERYDGLSVRPVSD